jgi:radical SAM superfamily enzyme YgiQ (UPF0313 family)
MRVLLVSANRTEINMRALPLGLGCVAAGLKAAGHEVQTLDLLEAQDVQTALEGAVGLSAPDAVGVSLRNIDDQNMRSPKTFLPEADEIIARVKSLTSAPVILGGAGYSIFPEAALARTQADMGICGEGEEALRLLLERIGRGQSLAGTPGLYLKGKGLQGDRVFVRDLDTFPLPGEDLLTLAEGSDTALPVQTRRGCPMGCSYCSTAAIEGRAVRKRSPVKVVEWIALWRAAGVRRLYFVDNTFNLPASYARSLCWELIAASLDVRWTAIVYPSRMDEDLADLMAEAGCVEAAVGFESGCERILKGMKKRFVPADIARTRAALAKSGIRCMGFLLLGGPGETRDSVKESLDFADGLECDSLKVTVGIRVYPGSPLAVQARREGIVAAEDDLLSPRFYMTPGLEEWIRETVADYARTRPDWVVDG